MVHEKIDDLVAHQKPGRRRAEEKEEMIPLGNFDIGDVIVINEVKPFRCSKNY